MGIKLPDLEGVKLENPASYGEMMDLFVMLIRLAYATKTRVSLPPEFIEWLYQEATR